MIAGYLVGYGLTAATFGLGDGLIAKIAASYGGGARQRVLEWERLILNNRSKSDAEKLQIVNEFFNRLKFVDDIDRWGRRDYWGTPVEMLATSAGDCEDYSIAKYFTLKELGVPIARLRLTYVKAIELGQAHMVLAYYPTPRAEPSFSTT